MQRIWQRLLLREVRARRTKHNATFVRDVRHAIWQGLIVREGCVRLSLLLGLAGRLKVQGQSRIDADRCGSTNRFMQPTTRRVSYNIMASPIQSAEH